jgi:hypothetical protein
MRFKGFVGGSYQLESKNFDRQRCVNLFAVLHEVGFGKESEVGMLIGTPGLRTLLTLAGGVTRGGYTASNGQAFAVGGNKLYRISSSWVATELGTLNTSTGRVSMVDNGTHLVIVDGGNGYVWNLDTSLFTAIDDEDFSGATMVSFLDGYFIFNITGTGRFQISGLLDTTIDGLDFATAEGNPDVLVSLLVDDRQLWLFGTVSTEIFYNSGNADFPFERISGGVLSVGCAAAFSVAKINNRRYWLGQDEAGFGMVYEAGGMTPERISTHAVELAIQGYSNIADATAYTYQQNGHNFYVLNFPSANTTWCFDATTRLWHERAYTNEGDLERHRAEWHIVAHGTHIVGDYENGKIYELDQDYYLDAGNVITKKRICPHISAGAARVTYRSLQLDIETGVGLDGDQQGTDPQAMMRFSDDGGHSWSNEKWTSFGAIGARLKRAIWRRMGASRDRVFEITITDPVPVRIIGAEIELEGNAN